VIDSLVAAMFLFVDRGPLLRTDLIYASAFTAG